MITQQSHSFSLSSRMISQLQRGATISATARQYQPQPKTILGTWKIHIGHILYRPQNITRNQYESPPRQCNTGRLLDRYWQKNFCWWIP